MNSVVSPGVRGVPGVGVTERDAAALDGLGGVSNPSNIIWKKQYDKIRYDTIK